MEKKKLLDYIVFVCNGILLESNTGIKFDEKPKNFKKRKTFYQKISSLFKVAYVLT